jgi:hypothetical protein
MASRLNSCSTLAETGVFIGKWEDELPMDYRDIEFPKGLTINDGLYLATSTTHTYDSYGTIGAARMYVQGQFF